MIDIAEQLIEQISASMGYQVDQARRQQWINWTKGAIRAAVLEERNGWLEGQLIELQDSDDDYGRPLTDAESAEAERIVETAEPTVIRVEYHDPKKEDVPLPEVDPEPPSNQHPLDTKLENASDTRTGPPDGRGKGPACCPQVLEVASRGIVTSSELEAALPVSGGSITRALRYLVAQGQLEKLGTNRLTRYQVPVLKKPTPGRNPKKFGVNLTKADRKRIDALPSAAPVTLNPLPVEKLTSPSDHFRCVPYLGAILTGSSCQERRKKATPSSSFALCIECQEGAIIEKRLFSGNEAENG